MNDTAGSGGRGSELSARAQAAADAPGGSRVKVEPLKQLLPYVLRYRGRVIAAFIALVVAALATLACRSRCGAWSISASRRKASS